MKVIPPVTEITVVVTVERGRTPQKVLDDTKRTQFIDGRVVDAMPLIPGKGKDTRKAVWFNVGCSINDEEVSEERTRRGLVRDLEIQAQYNAVNRKFADTHPNGDSWRDANDQSCFIAFRKWKKKRKVRVGCVGRRGMTWGKNWWFMGVLPED